jgi:hypothetical protein
MPTRIRLAALAHTLRHAPTSLLPIEIAERMQHAIVRIEEMLSSPVVDPAAVDAIAEQTKQLLAECDALRGKP